MTLTEVPTYILLCSDGLTGYIDADDIRDIVWGYGCDAVGEDDAEGGAAVRTEQLINRANEGGGGDNITALLIKYVGQDAEREKEKSQWISTINTSVKIFDRRYKVRIIGVSGMAVVFGRSIP